jgi:hypothetical protein
MTKVTANGKGYGKERNPYPKTSGDVFYDNPDYMQWEAEHPERVIIDQSGEVFMGSGEVEVELVWQWQDVHGVWETETNEDEFHTHNASLEACFPTRQVYILSLKTDQKRIAYVEGIL